jgi:hypothetical protein
MRCSPAREKLMLTNAVVVWRTVMLCYAIHGDRWMLVDFAYLRERPMNPVTQLPRHPSRRAFLNDDASLETGSRPIHVLRIDASPRASKSNSMALTDAFVTAYTDALPSVTVDVMNVWDEKLPS